MKFELNDQQVAIIGQALGDMPFKLSSGVIVELNKQIQEQQNAKELSGLPEQSS
jgi:hypothetical protein